MSSPSPTHGMDYEQYFERYDAQENLQKLAALEREFTGLEKTRQDQELAFLKQKHALLTDLFPLENAVHFPPKTVKHTVLHIYAIRSDLADSFFRIGGIELLHNPPLVPGHARSLHHIYAVAPTLNYSRDLASVRKHFQPNLKNNGWYVVYDHEITQYFNNVLLQNFNNEIETLYKANPLDTEIPPPEHSLIF